MISDAHTASGATRAQPVHAALRKGFYSTVGLWSRTRACGYTTDGKPHRCPDLPLPATSRDIVEPTQKARSTCALERNGGGPVRCLSSRVGHALVLRWRWFSWADPGSSDCAATHAVLGSQFHDSRSVLPAHADLILVLLGEEFHLRSGDRNVIAIEDVSDSVPSDVVAFSEFVGGCADLIVLDDELHD